MSALYIAANAGRSDLLRLLLSLGGPVYDHPAADGMTGFGLALGHKYWASARVMLESEALQPKEAMALLAAEAVTFNGREAERMMGIKSMPAARFDSVNNEPDSIVSCT